MSNKKKVYIGCSLTYATEEFKSAIENFKDKLRNKFEILDFIGLEKGTEKDVFEHDIKCVKDCDLFIADCTHPSTGLGMEIGFALNYNKEILIIAKKGMKITRAILGITHKNVSFAKYENMSEIIELINKNY